MHGFCCLYVGFGRDDDVFVVSLFLVRGVTLRLTNVDLFWFAGRVGCTVNGAPIGAGYRLFFLCNVKGSVGYLPSQVPSISDVYVDPREKLEVELDMFPPFVFIVTVVTVCSVLVVPLGLFEVN